MIPSDTIVAVSSPPGAAIRGIVRISGPECRRATSGWMTADEPPSPNDGPGFRRRSCRITLDSDVALAGDSYYYAAPHSYTGFDCIEIHTLGAPQVLELIVEKAIQGGARPALPGEFTAQALINGKMNLAEAESVAALIHAQSDAQLRAARAMKKSDLLQMAAAWQEELADLAALVEAEIDFAEEPIDFVSPTQLAERLVKLRSQWKFILDRAQSSARLEVLPRVLLWGRPNAGKSTLMNALTGLDRSICSPVAGTTRDILSASLHLDDIEVLLLDAAGVDPDEPVDLLRMARDHAMETSGEVDLVLAVIDAGDFQPNVLRDLQRSPSIPTLVVLNKRDLATDAQIEEYEKTLSEQFGLPAVATCARSGEGLGQLKRALRDRIAVEAPEQMESAIALSVRQTEALNAAMIAIDAAIDECRSCKETLDRVELLALFLREGLESLGELLGEVTTEDLLGKVFSQFCIGK